MKYFYPESEEEEEDDDQRLKLKEITQIVSVRDVDVETLGPVQQRNPIETDDLEYAVRGTFKDKEDTTGFEMKTSFCTLESMLSTSERTWSPRRCKSTSGPKLSSDSGSSTRGCRRSVPRRRRHRRPKGSLTLRGLLSYVYVCVACVSLSCTCTGASWVLFRRSITISRLSPISREIRDTREPVMTSTQCVRVVSKKR